MLERLHGRVLRPTGVAAVQDDVVGVRHVVLVGSHHQVGVVAPAVHAQRLGLEGPATERLRLGVVHRAADDGEHRGRRGPAPTIADDGVLAVFAIHALELVGNVGKRFVPADALPFVAAAQLAMRIFAATGLPMLALHGILQAVTVVDLLAQRASAQAASLLRAIPAVLACVVGFLPHNHAIHNVSQVRAHLVAILMAVNRHPLTALFGHQRIAGNPVVDFAVCILACGESLRCANGLVSGHGGHSARACTQESTAFHVLVSIGIESLLSRFHSSSSRTSMRALRFD